MTVYRMTDVYSPAVICRLVSLEFGETGTDVQDVLAARLASEIEGRCVVEGFVKPDSVRVQSFSAGLLEGARVCYEVQAACEVCCPAEGMEFTCVVRNVTKAGVRAEIPEEPSPMMIFLARDHHHRSVEFSKISAGDKITAVVVGQRFELNDAYVSVIATLPSRAKAVTPESS